MIKKVLVYRTGSIGDTIVALPAMWAAKAFFKDAAMTLICDRQVGRRIVLGSDLVRGAGLFDDFLSYPVEPAAGRLTKAVRQAALCWKLRRMKFDALVYLAPTNRTPAQITRDRRFFKLAGIKSIYGMEGWFDFPDQRAGDPLPTLPAEADLLLQRVGASGIPVPKPQEGNMGLGINDVDEAEFEAWRVRQPDCGDRPWIGIGPGSKMPAKLWPRERYAEVLRRMIQAFDVWPVIFGGKEDQEVGAYLISELGRGSIAAGELGLRASAAGLRHCKLYLGNDTGTMHLAVTVQTRCVAIFSARTNPGTWYPYGKNHVVLRHRVPCEGCELVECIEHQMKCLHDISVEEVWNACNTILTECRGFRLA